jgi:hypothetical protein
MKLFLTAMIVCCSTFSVLAQAHHMATDTAKRINPIPVFAANTPLFILNGKILRQDSVQLILPENIESIDILKGEKAQLAYGEKGKNGVVIITLKDLTKFRSSNNDKKNRRR